MFRIWGRRLHCPDLSTFSITILFVRLLSPLRKRPVSFFNPHNAYLTMYSTAYNIEICHNESKTLDFSCTTKVEIFKFVASYWWRFSCLEAVHHKIHPFLREHEHVIYIDVLRMTGLRIFCKCIWANSSNLAQNEIWRIHVRRSRQKRVSLNNCGFLRYILCLAAFLNSNISLS